ncbi:MAG TPA: amidase [Woeseiaceae bacterium]|nr:amidase [Woeseiaceae bacterium]
MTPTTILAVREELRARRISSTGLLQRCLARIDDPGGQGAKAFIRQFRAQARQAAAEFDAGRSPGALGGVPVSVKDLCDVAGSVTTAGSLVLRDCAPAHEDAPVVGRLRAGGAVIIGTNNMTEFAMGGVGINPHYGTPLNPWDRATGRIPGGSSSGGAVAVADQMVIAALGSDTAGSIQMPAALCGITGFKPTARRVPLAGTIPLAPSLDSIGPLANSVACCAAMDAVLAGEGPRPLAARRLEGLRLAVPQTLVLDDLEAPVAEAFGRALSRLSAAGVSISEIPFTELAEIPALSFSVVEGYAWHRQLLEHKRSLYDPIVAGRFASGAAVLAADYIALLRTRAELIRRSAQVTLAFDAVVMPTLPLVAPKLTDLAGNEALWLATNRRMIRNPGIANFLDRCAISLPCHRPGDAPVGLSLMGETSDDVRLLSIALAIEPLISQPPQA